MATIQPCQALPERENGSFGAPWTNEYRKPPTTAPTMPKTIVSSRLMCCRPGTSRRAIRPTIKPHSIQLRMVPTLICLTPHHKEKPAGFVARGIRFRVNGLPAVHRLPLTAVISPPILALGPVEVQRVPARLVACANVNQHAGHFLGMDWQDQAAIRSCLQHVLH